MRQLLPGVALLLLSGAVIAGQTAVTSQTVDTQGFDSTTFVANVGTVAAGGTLTMKIFGGEASDGSDKAAIDGAIVGVVATGANKKAVIEIHRPTSRYLTVVVTRAVADSTLVSIEALLYGASNDLFDQTQVSNSVALVSPPLA